MTPRHASTGSKEDASGAAWGEHEEPTGRSESRGSRATLVDGPWFRRGMLAAVLLILSIPLIATAAVAIYVDGDEVTEWLAPRLSGALNREVTLGDAGVAFLPRPGLRLSDVRVGGNAEESDLPSIVAVRDVHLQIAFLPLVTGTVHADRLRLSGLDVHLAVTEDGASNFGDLVPESSVVEMSRDGPVRFGIGAVEIEDASVTYFDAPGDRSFAVVGGSGALGLSVASDGGWIATVDGRADSLHLRLPELTDEIVRTDAPALALRSRGDASLDWVEIEEGTLTQWGESLEVSGRVEGLSEVDPRLDLRFANPALDLALFTRLVPPGTRARAVPALEGALDVRVSLRGSLRGVDPPALRGFLGLSNVGLRLGGEPLVTDLNGRIGLRAGAFALDSIVGTFADGPFLLDGRVDRTTEEVTASIVASPDLDGLDELGLTPFGSTLAGEADLVVDVVGPLEVPDSLRTSGSVRATGVQLEHDRIGVPLYGPVVELEVVDSELSWSEVTLLAGTDRLVTSGSLRGLIPAVTGGESVPSLDASLSGERLDITELLPPGEERPGLSYARIAMAHLGGRPISGRSPRGLVEAAGYDRPERLPVTGTVALDLHRLEYGVHELDSLVTRLEMSDSAIVVEDATFASWGGRATADLRVGIGSRVDEPFALRLEADGVEALDFLSKMTPVGEAVAGRLDMELAVDGSLNRSFMPVLESLRGGGVLVVRDGSVAGTGVNLALADFLAEERWRSIPFTEWRTDLTLEEGMLTTERSELVGERASATLSGRVGLGGAVDLAMALSVPADQLEAVSLRRTGVAQSVLDQLRESGSSLDLGIRISGTLQGPTLEPDALAAAERPAAMAR